MRKPLEKALDFAAARMQLEVGQIHAPRPDASLSTAISPSTKASLVSSVCAFLVRHPMHVLIGCRAATGSAVVIESKTRGHERSLRSYSSSSEEDGLAAAASAPSPSSVVEATICSHSTDEMASPPAAGCHICSPVSSSVIHSPSAQSISA